MGRKARLKPKRLAEKLLHIRSALGYSQREMLRQLGFEDLINYRRVSEFELGANEPPLPVLLAYARAAGVSKTSSPTTWIYPPNFPATSTTVVSPASPLRVGPR